MEVYCCQKLNELINDEKTPFEYSQKFRQYNVVDTPRAYLKKNEICMAYAMQYCPFCSTEFPRSLREEWFHIINDEYRLEFSIFDKKSFKKIPEEFRTEEWWKKRGL